MLSYRHSFHAGNYADVFKHFCLYQTLTFMKRKEKPLLYFDSHAGAGFYDLHSAHAEKTGEYCDGIMRLYAAQQLPSALIEFRNDLRLWLESENVYCGSPWLAAHLLGEHDTLQACELHPNDAPALQHIIRSIRPRRSFVFQKDGFVQLLASVPPPQRRALIVIDPSYEQKSDYDAVCSVLSKALKKFAQGCYLIWSPCLLRTEAQDFPQQLAEVIGGRGYLRAQLKVRTESALGMYGCEIHIINPPYLLAPVLQEAGNVLVQILAADKSAQFQLWHRDAAQSATGKSH